MFKDELATTAWVAVAAVGFAMIVAFGVLMTHGEDDQTATTATAQPTSSGTPASTAEYQKTRALEQYSSTVCADMLNRTEKRTVIASIEPRDREGRFDVQLDAAVASSSTNEVQALITNMNEEIVQCAAQGSEPTGVRYHLAEELVAQSTAVGSAWEVTFSGLLAD